MPLKLTQRLLQKLYILYLLLEELILRDDGLRDRLVARDRPEIYSLIVVGRAELCNEVARLAGRLVHGAIEAIAVEALAADRVALVGRLQGFCFVADELLRLPTRELFLGAAVASQVLLGWILPELNWSIYVRIAIDWGVGIGTGSLSVGIERIECHMVGLSLGISHGAIALKVDVIHVILMRKG